MNMILSDLMKTTPKTRKSWRTIMTSNFVIMTSSLIF